MDTIKPSPPSNTASPMDIKGSLSLAQARLREQRQQAGLPKDGPASEPASAMKTLGRSGFDPARQLHHDRSVERRAARDRQRKTQSIIGNSGLPRRHLNQVLDASVDSRWGDARDRAVQAASAGMNLLLWGNRGTGKTQIATAAGLAFAGRQQTVQYFKASQLFRLLRQAMHDNREVEAIDQVCRKGLLILDEAHVRGETDYEDRTLIEIFDRRYDSLRPTILITNLQLDAAKESLGSSIIDRFVETGMAIACEWPSLRAARRVG